jgi:hypothetical protein
MLFFCFVCGKGGDGGGLVLAVVRLCLRVCAALWKGESVWLLGR